MLDHHPGLETLNGKQLRQLIAEAGAQLAVRQDADRRDARAKIIAIADEVGLALEDILAEPQKRRAPARNKYSDGEGNFWTGKGRTPTWLQGHLDEGKTKEDFFIKD
jgi:DNA-binding protein H-NS